MSISYVNMLEQNVDILFDILDDEIMFSKILSENMYEFYVMHMLSYTNSYDQANTNTKTLVKAILSLERIFNHIVQRESENAEVEVTF